LSCHIQAAAERGVATTDSVLAMPSYLPPDACARLRGTIDNDWQEKRDSVDGGPDHQLHVTKEQFARVVGSANASKIWKLPHTFEEFSKNIDTEEEGQASSWQILIRRYSPETRPWIPFHVDAAAVTINIALNADETFEGGRLLTCTNHAIRVLPRDEGDLTIHSSSLLHAVTQMHSGVRYSLIMFIGNAAERPKDLIFDGSDGMPTRKDEELCLLSLLSNETSLQQWRRVCTTQSLQILRDHFEEILEREVDLGRAVEREVVKHDAPHLRPTRILEVAHEHDAAFFSLRQLVLYMYNRIQIDSQENF
jgi:hypothetical protein